MKIKALPGVILVGPLAAYCQRYGEIERKKVK